MVVLPPEGEIRASDIPRDIRERGRGLPVRVPAASRDVAGQELEFIFHSLVDLKLQIEELRRRIEERPQRVEVIEVGHGDRKSTRLNSSHLVISYAVFCLKKKNKHKE